MFSKSLFKKTVKDNYKFWLIITSALSLMLIMVLTAASNFVNQNNNGAQATINMMVNHFYTMFAMLLPMIYIVMVGNRLIAAQIDRGSFAYIMSKPIKRNQVSLTQALYLASSIVVMFIIITLIGLIMIGITGLNIEIGAFLLINLGIVLFHLAISSISYLSSCIFNVSSKSLLVGAGIPVLFFLFNMLAEFSGIAAAMGYFRFFTLNTLFDVADIMNYSLNLIWQYLILFGVAVIGYTSGAIYFKNKDLPL